MELVIQYPLPVLEEHSCSVRSGAAIHTKDKQVLQSKVSIIIKGTPSSCMLKACDCLSSMTRPASISLKKSRMTMMPVRCQSTYTSKLWMWGNTSLTSMHYGSTSGSSIKTPNMEQVGKKCRSKLGYDETYVTKSFLTQSLWYDTNLP